MVNRVLIRIKVIQILYSYLLTRSEFKIEGAPETTSHDRLFAYKVYVDMMLLMLELSGYGAHSNSLRSPLAEACDNAKLRDNRMVKALSTEDAIRRLILKGNTNIEAFDSLLAGLYEAITNSTAYRSYVRKKERTVVDDVTLWTTLIPTVLAKSEALVLKLRELGGYTVRGFDYGVKMVCDTLKEFSDNRSLLFDAKSALARSLDKAYELYHALLLLPIYITRLEDERLETARTKYMATPEDLNPNMRFVENAFVRAIAENPSMKAYLKAMPISWDNEPLLIRSLLDNILNSEIYKEYMASTVTDYNTDCELWRNLMRTVILPSDDLAEVLENSSVYWNDDLQIMGTFVLKTIKQFATAEGGEVELLPQFKDDEDAAFGEDLFMLVVNNQEKYREYIDKFIDHKQWDSERIAFMDVVIMSTAIAELLNFPLIPVPVTLNEYIEIANSYSTAKSGQFINGILYSVIKYLKEEGILTKEVKFKN